MKYHNAAIVSVNSRLGHPELGNTDGIVASIVGFACHSRQTANYDIWQTHMEALDRILHTRGGPDSVKLPMLRLLLYLVDTTGCCEALTCARAWLHNDTDVSAGTRDLRPRFRLPKEFLPDPAQLYLQYTVAPEVVAQLNSLLQKYPAARRIARIIKDLGVIIQWLNDESLKDSEFYQPSSISGKWLVPLVYRCLDLKPDETERPGDPEVQMLEILRHSVILFMQPIRRRFAINTGPLNLHILKLRCILETQSIEWQNLEPLLRWCIVSAGIEATTTEDQAWFATLLASHEAFQNVHSDAHLRALPAFIWKEDILKDLVLHFLLQVEDTKKQLHV